MCRLFTFITCIVIAAGAVGDNGIVKVKRGENFSLCVRTSELKIVSLRKVQKNGTQVIFRYCSSEEQIHGCKPINSGRFSLQIGNENFSVTFLDASTSDEGDYIIEVIDNKNKWIQHNYSVSLTEQLPSTINSEPPSVHPLTTPAVSTKGKEAFGTNGPITTDSTEQNRKITWGIIGGLTGLVVAIVIGIIRYKMKKQDDNDADFDAEVPGESIPLNSNANGAGELDTEESLEIVVETNSSVDNKEGPVHGA